MKTHPHVKEDPALVAGLAQAHEGTAFFTRLLDDLSYTELDGPSLLAHWSRKHVVAHIAYNAFAIGRLVEWARTGVEHPMYETQIARDHEIEAGATLSHNSLRSLFDRSGAELDAAWASLPANDWHKTVRTFQGREIHASETIWMRTKEVWVHAVDLDGGASFDDIPEPVLSRLLVDIAGAWQKRGESAGLVLRTRDSEAKPLECGDTAAKDPVVVSGGLADLTAWAAGRYTVGVTSSSGTVPEAPHWI
jgi:maleylpyruvate isomerase